MEKINTDYNQRIWKIETKLFNMRKPWRRSFNNSCLHRGVVQPFHVRAKVLSPNFSTMQQTRHDSAPLNVLYIMAQKSRHWSLLAVPRSTDKYISTLYTISLLYCSHSPRMGFKSITFLAYCQVVPRRYIKEKTLNDGSFYPLAVTVWSNRLLLDQKERPWKTVCF